MQPRYLLDEILEDIECGHNIVATVFIECGAMFKVGGDEHLRAVGETEFVNGIAAMHESGIYGATKVAAAIFVQWMTVDTLAGEVLDMHLAAGCGRFRGIRRAVAWDSSNEIRNHRANPPPNYYCKMTFVEVWGVEPQGLTFEAWCYHTQIAEVTDLARNFRHKNNSRPFRRSPWNWPMQRKTERDFSKWNKDIVELTW